MDLQTFFDGINLMPEAVEKLHELSVSDEKYERMRQLFYDQRKNFFEEVLKEEKYRLYFLYYYCRMASDLYETYQEKQIEESVYWDTFYDITLWCQNCYRDYQEYGIQEYYWLPVHLDLRIFRYGRLQFETVENGNNLSGNKPFINIHIPQGQPLDMDLCKASLQTAFQLYGTEIAYLCDSWLLSPALREIMKPDSNIIQFQNLFEIVEEDYECRQAEERIFDQVQENPQAYSEKTSLQRNAKKYLMEGKKIGVAVGRLKMADIK